MTSGSRPSWSLAVLGLVGLLGFLLLAILVRQNTTIAFDRRVTQAIQRPDSAALLDLSEAVSWPGEVPQGIVIGLLCAIAFALARRWPEGVAILLSILAFPLTLVIKGLVARPRPSAALDGVIVHGVSSGSGFPSAHVLCYMALGGFLAYLAATRLRGALRAVLVVLALALLILIGPARIYLGEHWFTDVVASYLLGLACLVALIALDRWAMRRGRRAEDREQKVSIAN